jgi:predicted RNA-binding Zn-ribbon protein involved in translation (DUF1610 family)
MSDITYRLCPHCLRAVPAKSAERFCPNDGTKMISHCPTCGSPIHNPYARHCTGCGLEFAAANADHRFCRPLPA